MSSDRHFPEQAPPEDIMRTTNQTTFAPSGAQVPMTQAAPQEFFSRSAGNSDVDSLQIKRLVRIFRRHFLMIIAFSVVFGGAMAAYEMVLNTDRIPEWMRIGPRKQFRTALAVEQVQTFATMQVNLGSLSVKPITVNMNDIAQILRDKNFLEKYAEVLRGMIGAENSTIPAVVRPLLERYLKGEKIAVMSATPVRNGWATVTAVGPHPEMLPHLLAAMPRALNEYGKINRSTGIDSALKRLKEVRKKNQDAMAESSRQLRLINEKLDILLPKGENSDEKLIDQNKQLLEGLQNKFVSLQSQIKRLKESSGYGALQEKFFIGDDADLEKVLIDNQPLRREWLKMSQRIENLLVRYTEDHPQIMNLRVDIEAIQTRLKDMGWVTSLGQVPPLPNEWQVKLFQQVQELNSKILVAQDELSSVETRLAELRKKAADSRREQAAAAKSEVVTEEQNKRDAIRTELDILHNQTVSMTGQIGQLQSAKVQFDEETEFSEPTHVNPAVLVGPRWWIDVPVMFGLGLLIGCGLAFLSETTDNRLHTPMDVYYHLRLNYLGVVPLWSDREQMIIPPERPDSHIAEVYAHLCNNIRYGREGNPERRLLVASATQAEGKSTTAVNMAIRYALEGNQVLLIDADMRRPKVHKTLGMYQGGGNVPGLSDYLAGASSFKEVCAGSQIPGLSVIWAGSRVRNPAKLLGGPAMAQMLDEAEKTFDVIIVDCPAVLPVVDATILAPHMRGVLLVIAAEEVELGAVRMAMYRLQHVGAPMLGAVLNKVCERSTSYTYYGYRYRAGYYYSPYSKTYGEKDDTNSLA